MKIAPLPSTSEFIWPSLSLLFSVVAGAGCVIALAYALLLVLDF